MKLTFEGLVRAKKWLMATINNEMTQKQQN